MKDRFSAVSDLYSRFRPTYPKELYDHLLTLIPGRTAVWDCGTGNGQAAVALSAHFERVYATDMSREQIRNATERKNITYRVERAEQTSFRDGEFDLVTVAQAAHWFDLASFYREAERVLKPSGVIALFGYSLCRVNAGIDAVIDHFHRNVVGPYWDKEREHVDEEYRTLPFPFTELQAPKFSARYEWEVEWMLGFLGTWSASQRFREQTGNDPLQSIEADLRKEWGNTTKSVLFPVFARTGIKDGKFNRPVTTPRIRSRKNSP